MQNLSFLAYIYIATLGIISYLICLKAARSRVDTSISSYLYSGNTIVLAIGSTLGTIFSVAVLFTAITALSMIYGYIAFLLIFVFSYFGLYFVNKNIDIVYDHSDKHKGIQHKFETRFNSLFINEHKSLLYLAIATLYLFLMCITEVGALKNFIIFSLDDDFYNFLIIYVTLFCSISYVYVGGFYGVLITDMIQAVIIVIALVSNIVIFALDSSNTIKIDIYIVEKLCIKNTLETAVFAVGTLILSVCWFGAAPEIWKRIITLNKKNRGKKNFNSCEIFTSIYTILTLSIYDFVIKSSYR